MSQVDTWLEQANEAVRRGADPAAVERLLLLKMQRAGLEPDTSVRRHSDFENVESGSVSTALSPRDKQINDWYSEAQKAIQAGADESKVQALMRAKIGSLGLSAKDGDLGLTRFGSVEGGVDSSADEAYVPGFGETETEFYDRKERESKEWTMSDREKNERARAALSTGQKVTTDLEGVGRTVASGVGRAASGLTGIATGALSTAVGNISPLSDADQRIADFGFSMRDAIRRDADAVGQVSPLASENVQYGAFLPQLLGGFAVEPFERGVDVLNQGKSLTQAELALAQQGAVNVLGIGTGMLGSQARGLGALASRAGFQVPASVALGTADRTLRGEETTKKNIAEDVGMGVFGSLFRNVPRSESGTTAPLQETPKTGDPSMDAGIQFVEDLLHDRPKAPSRNELAPEQTDMFSPQSELSVDMFSGETVPASLMEQRRRRQEQANRGEEAQRSPEEDLQLERDYLIDQQNRLNEEMRVAQDEPAAQADLSNYGIPEVSREPTSARLTQDAEGNPVGYEESGTNTAIRDAFREAGERRTTGLQNQDMFGGPYREAPRAGDVLPETFTPSRNAEVDQRPVQESLDLESTIDRSPQLPPQGDLFGGQEGPATRADTPITPKAEEAPVKVEAPKKETPVKTDPKAQLAALLKAKRDKDTAAIEAADPELAAVADLASPVLAPNTPRQEAIRNRMVEGLQRGDLTAREVFALAREAIPSDTPAQRALLAGLDYLEALGKRFGGLDTTMTYGTPDTMKGIPGSVLLDKPNRAGVFHPATNRVYIRANKANLATLVHEASHGITSKLLEAGQKGKLTGPAAAAFKSMDDLFQQVVQPELLRLAEEKYAGTGVPHAFTKEGYGATNIHEFYSEFFSNAQFREQLKSIKIDAGLKSRYKGSESLLDKAKTLYDVAVKGVSKLLSSAGIRSVQDMGTAAKAESALDVMFSAMDKFHNAVGDNTARAIKDINSRNTQPNTSFLGERVESRVLAKDEAPAPTRENLQKPRGKLTTTLKALFSSKGIEAKVHDARMEALGISAEGNQRAIAAANRLSAALKAAPGSEDLVASVLRGEKPLSALDGELRASVEQFNEQRIANAYAYAEAIASNPNATDKELAFAIKAIEDAETYVTRAFRGHHDPAKPGIFKWMSGGYLGRKLKLAQRAEGKLGDKSNIPLTKDQIASLTKDEAKALGEYRALRSMVTDMIYPQDIHKYSVEQLQDLYELHYPGKKGIDITSKLEKKADKKNALSLLIKDAILKNSDMNALVDETVRAMSGLAIKRGQGAIGNYVRNLRLGKDVFAERTDVPKELREWWGEIEHPVANVLQTLSTQAARIGQITALNRLAELEGDLFTRDNGRAGTHTEPLTGERFGSLQGLRATPDVAKALDSILELDSSFAGVIEAAVADRSNSLAIARGIVLPALGAIARPLAALKKYVTVVLNPGRAILNGAGSPGMMLANGNLNLATAGRGIVAMARMLRADKATSVDPDVATLYRYNLVESTQLSEIMDSSGRARILEILDQAGGKPKSLMRILGRAADKPKEWYSATDLWTKFANFFHEVDILTEHYKKIGVKKTDHEIKLEAAERTNNTNITPSRAPQIAKFTERFGGTQFLPYFTETARVTVNNVALGYKDMKRGIETGDMRMARNGLQRFAGSTIGMAYATAMQKPLTAAMLAIMGYSVANMGENDKEQQAFLELQDQFKGSDILKIQGNDGKSMALDIGQMPPLDPTWRVINGLLKAVGKAGEGDKKGALKAVDDAFDNAVGLLSANSVWKDVSKAITGADPSFKNKTPESYNDTQKFLQEAGVSEANVNRLLNLVNIGAPKVLTETLSTLDKGSTGGERAIKAAGFPVVDIDPAKDLNKYFGQSRKAEMQEAKTKFADLMKQPWDASEELADKIFTQAMKDIAKPFSELKQAVKAAKEQGVPRTELVRRLKQLNLNNDTVGAVIADRKFPMSSLTVELEKDLEAKLLEDIKDPAKLKEARARYRRNTKMAARLLRKYRKVDIEQFADGEVDGL